MTVDRRLRLGDTTRAPALWAANLLGPLAVLLGQELGYAFVQPACGTGDMTAIHLGFVGAILLAMIGGGIGWREWGRWGRTPSTDREDAASRSRFMAILGLVLSALSVLVLSAQWLATAFFNSCQ